MAVTSPLVSVVIPCYNHGRYLSGAIESVKNQTHSPIEIVVIDDGSTDNTKEVANSYIGVTYVLQTNQGLSASRNAGAKISKGDYIIFLDADDWLYPEAVAVNLRYLQQHPDAAFVSGAYNNVYEDENKLEECKIEVSGKHYTRFLGFNYVGMIAAVMFRRWIFGEFCYNASLKACEDHDLYLRISRKYPVTHHTEIISAYRRHRMNMSGNIPVMLSEALKVLKYQKSFLYDNEDKQAFDRSYKSLYKQFHWAGIGIKGEEEIAFKEDYYSYYKYKILVYLNRLLATI